MSNFFDRMVPENETDDAPAKEVGLPLPGSLTKPSDVLPQTPSKVKQIAQELLKHGYLEESQKPDLFQAALRHEKEIGTVLEPLDLELRLDTHRGVAYLRIASTVCEGQEEDIAWLHPLVRRQRLTLEQSLLVAILRQVFVVHEQESGVGQSEAKIAVDDLMPQFKTFFGDSGSDAKNESRLSNLLDQLKPHGIVSEVDKKQEVTIRPLIAHLANPESLTALLRVLKAQGESAELAEQSS